MQKLQKKAALRVQGKLRLIEMNKKNVKFPMRSGFECVLLSPVLPDEELQSMLTNGRCVIRTFSVCAVVITAD